MKKNVFIGLFLFSLFTYGQSGTFNINSNIDLPTIMPPTPTAFQMTQYGDIPVNEASGSINPSFTLFNYTAGKLSLPKSMSYVSDGVKVDQAAGWTGIGWNINAGGVVTRTVRGLPDEKSGIIKRAYSYSELNHMNIQQGTVNTPPTDDYNEIYIFMTDVSNVIDSEVDIFNYSFPGYSGSFYLDRNLVPILINYNKKINVQFYFDGTIKVITIKLPDGTTYFFGGINGCEDTKASYPLLVGGAQEYATTAFYLFRISNIFSDVIELEYQSETDHNVEIGRSQSKSRVISIEGMCPTGDNVGLFQYSEKEDILRQHIKAKKLSRIYSNRNHFEIRFTRIQSEYPSQYKDYLRKVSVIDTDNISQPYFKEFEFDYKFFSTRFFMDKITSYSDGQYESEYVFTYKNPESLPPRFSFKQDHWGYFNNKPNITLLPKNQSSHFNFYYLADRKMDFEYATMGILKDIKYPTKGVSHFEYEGVLNYDRLEPKMSDIQVLTIYYNDSTRVTHGINESKFIDFKSVGRSIDVDDNVIELPSQTITAELNMQSTNNIIHGNFVKVEVIENQNNRIIFSRNYHIETLLNNGVYNYTTNVSFDIETRHTYKITLQFYTSNPDSGTSNPTLRGMNSTNHLNTSLHYRYIEEMEPSIEGIRIKSIANIDNGIKSYKRLYYKSLINVISDSKEHSSMIYPIYNFTSTSKICCGLSGKLITYANLQSSSVNSIYLYGSYRKNYEYVTTSIGDDIFTLGAVENQYILENDAMPYNYFNTPDYLLSDKTRENKSVVNGNLLKSTKYIKKNENYYKLEESINNYLIDRSISITNNVRRKFDNIMSCMPGYENLEYFYLGIYNTYSTRFELIETQTKSYINDVAYNDENDNPNTYILDRTNYVNLFPGIPWQIEKTDSQNNVLKTKISYTPAYLIPEKQTRYFNNVVIDSTVTIFHINYPQLLPGLVKTVKGVYHIAQNPMQDRLIYHDYTFPHGNPKEVSKVDGPHIFYIWGYYGNYPIAKIENINSSQLTAVQNLIDIAVQKSDLDHDRTMHYAGGEGQLRQALDAIRNHPDMVNTLVSTYTHDPFIGITSITDPKGDIQYYIYDNFYKLLYVKDKNGNILSENQYHYRD